MAIEAVFKLPFEEAETFFRGKINIPTARWDDLKKEQHAKGFMIAGAARDELLADFRAAVDKAIAEGVTLESFRKDFDRIVKKHGWSYNGSRNWRSEVIYATNIRTAYQAGRWAQLTDPDLLKTNPYLLYRHGDSIRPRPLHLAWDGLTLAADDPWWKTHYPPNGWGCKCKAFSAGPRDLERAGKSGPDSAPQSPIDPLTGAPEGIDKGWDYNVGEAAWGQSKAAALMEEQGRWQDLLPWGPGKYRRPEKLSVESPRAQLGTPVKKGDAEALRGALREAVGADAAVMTDPLGDKVQVTQAITDHILAKASRQDGREAYFPFIRELIEDPYEIWVNFAKNEISGRVAVRRKYVKAVRVGKNRVLGLYAEIQEGAWVSGDLFRGGLTGAGNLRKGRMIYGK